MNIISHFKEIVENNFNKFLKNYFTNNSNLWEKSGTIDNYINFMIDLDSFNYSFMTNVIKDYLEYVDDVFFNTTYRKSFCQSKGFYERTILTLFGEVTYKRRYYYDKNYNDRFFFTDLFLGLPKRKYFDPFVCSEICNESASSSYSKSGRIVASKIGNRINNLLSITRASARNIVIQFNLETIQEYDNKRIERLFVMLDEKFVGSQYNEGKDHMIKAAVVFEDTELEYKTKRKPDSMDRYRLVNSHTCASIDNNLLNDTVEYIYNMYNPDYIKEIVFMGDCATWIKNFPNSYWFKFNEETKVKFAMDGFHFSQALENLTTEEYKDVYDELYQLVIENNKKDFIRLSNEFLDINQHRKDVIESKIKYILNNWNERQLYQNNAYMRCSMESHISHIFADIFTSRPKAYSEKGLRQLLKLRLLKVNKKDIRQIYLDSLKPKEELKYQNNLLRNKIINYYDKIQIHFNKTLDNFINEI